jgi:hypothetical protein
MTEWMRVMLEEIERKRGEAEQAEFERRRREDRAPGLADERAPRSEDKLAPGSARETASASEQAPGSARRRVPRPADHAQG